MYFQSLREKIGQLLVSGFEGTSVNSEIEKLIIEKGIGGVILFERNYKNPEQLTDLLHDMQSLAISKNGLPLFISVDQEGGRVSRLKKPFSSFPFQSVLARAGLEDLAFRFGQGLGAELKSVGVNIDFAPVLDINTNPENPIIGRRAISNEPKTTAQFGSAIIRGFINSGIIPVGKHFPGHGDTKLDSHYALPVISKGAKILENLELIPFISAIRAGLPIIMTAHVIYPIWDKYFPATFSPFILRNILRDKLGFEGLIISDDLEMKAIETIAFDSIAELGFTAGLDLFLICHDIEKTLALRDQIIRAIESGRLSHERVNESLQRVFKLKNNLNVGAKPDRSELDTISLSNQKLIEELTAAQ